MKKKGLFWVLGWFALGITFVSAQVGGTATFRFLSLPSSADQVGLGGKQTVDIHNNPLQNFINPALIDSAQTQRVALNYSNWITDIHYGQLAYVWHTKLGPIFTGVHYINYGRFVEADELGNITGNFHGNETAISLGYAYRLHKRWHAGINLKWIHSVLANYRSNGLAIDLGVLYKNNRGGSLALVLRNIGKQLTTYNGTNEPLPFEIDITYAQLLEHAPLRLFLTAENLQKPRIAFINTAYDQTDPNGNIIHQNIGFVDHVFRHIIVGAEFFPRKRFNLRMGYNFRRAAELGLKDIHFSSGLSFGMRIHLGKFDVQYGYGQMHAAGNNHFIGLILLLNPNS